MPLPALAARSRAGHALALLLICFASACASGGGANFVPPSRPAQFSMAGIPWGISIDSVKALIEPRGYNFNRVDEDADLWFDGVLNRVPTRVFAFMADQKLVKLRMLIITPDSAALPTYQTTRTELLKQFGAPKETIEEYEAPFKKGDRKELDAVRSGKATLRTYWLPTARARMSHVAVEVTDKAVVTVDYEGPAWERESVRRRQQR